MAPYRWSLEHISATLSDEQSERFAEIFTHGTLRLGLYEPRGEDHQSPHDQDEVYIITRGNGWFRNGDDRHRFEPGDALFVPAGIEHRFEDFTEDLAAWVIFYGPPGGEEAEASSSNG